MKLVIGLFYIIILQYDSMYVMKSSLIMDNLCWRMHHINILETPPSIKKTKTLREKKMVGKTELCGRLTF